MAERCEANGPAKLEPVVNTFGPIVYRWCRKSGLDPENAADAVQDVFVSVAKNIDRFERKRARGSFRAWLATITRNRVRDHLRRESKRETAAGGTAALRRLHERAADLESTICPDSIENPLVRRVLESVEPEFETRTFRAFWLTAVEGRTASEAGETLGLSTASVYQAKSRVLRRLRTRLDEFS